MFCCMWCHLVLCIEGHAKWTYILLELIFWKLLGSTNDWQMSSNGLFPVCMRLNPVSQCSRSRSVSRLSAACYARVRRMRASVLDSRAPCEEFDSCTLAPGRGGKQSGQFAGHFGHRETGVRIRVRRNGKERRATEWKWRGFEKPWH